MRLHLLEGRAISKICEAISPTASELVLFLARCGAPADRAVRSAGSVDSVGHSRDKVYSIHDWACAFIGNRVESKVSKHIIAA